MSEINRLRLAGCLIGAVLWAMGGAHLCLLCFEAPSKDKHTLEETREWAHALGETQKRAMVVSSLCGAVLGLLTCRFFERRPQADHVEISPENRGKLFGLAPKTKADVVVPFQAALVGVAACMTITAFVLPALRFSDALVLKRFSSYAVICIIESTILTIPILPFSLKAVYWFAGGRGDMRTTNLGPLKTRDAMKDSTSRKRPQLR